MNSDVTLLITEDPIYYQGRQTFPKMKYTAILVGKDIPEMKLSGPDTTTAYEFTSAAIPWANEQLKALERELVHVVGDAADQGVVEGRGLKYRLSL